MNPLLERIASQHRKDLEEDARMARLAALARCCPSMWARLVKHVRVRIGTTAYGQVRLSRGCGCAC